MRWYGTKKIGEEKSYLDGCMFSEGVIFSIFVISTIFFWQMLYCTVNTMTESYAGKRSWATMHNNHKFHKKCFVFKKDTVSTGKPGMLHFIIHTLL